MTKIKISNEAKKEIKSFEEKFFTAKEIYDTAEESVVMQRINLRHSEKIAEDAYNEAKRRHQELILHLRNYIPKNLNENLNNVINIVSDSIIINDGKEDIIENESEAQIIENKS